MVCEFENILGSVHDFGVMWAWLLPVPVALVVYDWWKRRAWVDNIQNKAVFITGCDTGFGYAAAKSLYTRGVHVYAGCYTESGAKKLEQETGERLKPVLIDVTNNDSINTAVKYVRSTLPRDKEFWGLINNAGVLSQTGPAEFLNKADFKQAFDVNVCGMVEVTNAFLPMLKRTKGRVVNMSSIAGEVGFPGWSPYVASKHAACGYSNTLRMEQDVWGVKVSTIEPGFFKTNITSGKLINDKFRERWNQLDPRIKDDYGEDYYRKSMSRTESLMEKEGVVDLNQVVKAYEHALFSVQPRAAYYPGVGAKLIMFMKYLPHVIFDKYIASTINMYPKAVVDKTYEK